MTDRPADAPPADAPLLLAARYNDAEAEDHELREVVEKRGLGYDDLEYIARQRALKVTLLQNGRSSELRRGEPVNVMLNDDEKSLMEALIPLYIDAIFIGWRARELDGTS